MMIHKPIIGLHGRAHVGKSTAAQLLKNALSLRAYDIAQPVICRCAELLGISEQSFLALPKNHLVMKGVTKRQLMQNQGALIRQHDNNALLYSLTHRIAADNHEQDFYRGLLITDIRMPHEADWLRQKGGTLVHILRPDAAPAPADETEQHLDIIDGDPVVHNTGSRQDFEKKILALTTELRAIILAHIHNKDAA
ncbi:MAG: hypothetical protein KTR20_12715 [Cellvibrionaceae bacterium]|nr:hypothetical protein [Cellvibrionaceae bacterium]